MQKINKRVQGSVPEKKEKFVLAPASVPQQQFLNSTSTITLYAGSAGAGKTFAIILNMVKFMLRQNSTIVCFRRNSTQLRQNGGIWQEAVMIFKKMFGSKVVIRNRDLEIYLPETNATLKFSHLQYQSDVHNHLGAQYSVIFFDEATTFEPFEEFVLPLLGRLRNANVDYEPCAFWATNPKYDHGIYHWIKDYYLDDLGIPIDERSNVERYFVLENNKPVWFDTRQEAEAVYGSGPGTGIRSFRAIKAHVTQNLPLMKANPEYISNLKAMPEIKRRIYLDGSWTAREEEAGLFLRTFTKVIPYPVYGRASRVRAWDTASTKPSSASPDPDWTRGLLMSKTQEGMYTIEDLKSVRDRPFVVEQLILNTAREDPPGTTVVLQVEPGSAGIAYANSLKVKLAELGVYTKLETTNKSKRTRFLPFAALAEAGMVQVVAADYVDELFDELERFNGTKNNGHDDIADTCSSAVWALNLGGRIPDIVVDGSSVVSTAPAFNLQNTSLPGSMGLPTS